MTVMSDREEYGWLDEPWPQKPDVQMDYGQKSHIKFVVYAIRMLVL